MMRIIRSAFGLPNEPARASAPPTTQLVPVPIVRPQNVVERPQATMGYLDRHNNAGPMGAIQSYGPPLRTADMDVRSGWGHVTGHVRHIVQNSGWIAGAVDQTAAYVVGTGLTPQIEPQSDLLGWEPSFAKTWARRVEKMFDDWANDPLSCDDREQWTLGQMQAAAVRGWFTTGDVISIATYRRKPEGILQDRVDRSRSRSSGDPAAIPRSHRRATIRASRWMAAGGRSPTGSSRCRGRIARGTRIPVWSGARQQLVHSFIGDPGQVRGISPFAPVVEAIRQTQSLSDAMVLAAHAAAALVGTVTSDLPSDNLAQRMSMEGGDPLASMQTARVAWHEQLAANKANVTLGAEREGIPSDDRRALRASRGADPLQGLPGASEVAPSRDQPGEPVCPTRCSRSIARGDVQRPAGSVWSTSGRWSRCGAQLVVPMSNTSWRASSRSDRPQDDPISGRPSSVPGSEDVGAEVAVVRSAEAVCR